MRVVKAWPPNIDEVRKRFTLKGREIFAWGDIIYNPAGGELSPWLHRHEEVHQRQQGDDVEGWWKTYLEDDDFRFNMELEAHQVEYAAFCELHTDRNKRARYLLQIGARLSGKMYGNIVSLREAVRLIAKS